MVQSAGEYGDGSAHASWFAAVQSVQSTLMSGRVRAHRAS